MRFRVPGNLILMGEYAVLEDGGMGVTAAMYPCAEGTLTDDDRLTGSQNGRILSFFSPVGPGSRSRENLPAYCWQALDDYARNRGLNLRSQGVHVSTDSFAAGGIKLGYGSSAAAAAAFVRGVLEGQIWKESVSFPEQQSIACRAHSLFQGRAGSGYDVYTSFSRGINLFLQGRPPGIKPLDLPFLPNLYLYHSPRSVSTVGSVGEYREWKKNHPADAFEYLQSSNALIREFKACTHWDEGQNVLKKAGVLGRILGEAIGVSANIEVPEEIHSFSDTVWKASGAGNELVLMASHHDLSIVPGVEKVRIYDA